MEGQYSPLINLVTVKETSPSVFPTLREELDHLRKSRLGAHGRVLLADFKNTLEFYNNLIAQSDPTREGMERLYPPAGVSYRNYLPLAQSATEAYVNDSVLVMELLEATELSSFNILRNKLAGQPSKQPLIDDCERLLREMGQQFPMSRVQEAFKYLVGEAMMGYPEDLFNYLQITGSRQFLPAGLETEILTGVHSVPRPSHDELNSGATPVGKCYPKKVPDTRLEYLITFACRLWSENNGLIEPSYLAKYTSKESLLQRQVSNMNNTVIDEIVEDATPALSDAEQREWKQLLTTLLHTTVKVDPVDSGIGIHYIRPDKREHHLFFFVSEAAFAVSGTGLGLGNIRNSDSLEDTWPSDMDSVTLTRRYAQFLHLHHLRKRFYNHIAATVPAEPVREVDQQLLDDRAERWERVVGRWNGGDWYLHTNNLVTDTVAELGSMYGKIQEIEAVIQRNIQDADGELLSPNDDPYREHLETAEKQASILSDLADTG